MPEVIITSRAETELRLAHDWWAENRSVEQAHRWYLSFVRTMISLENCPDRWPLAVESHLFPFDVRQLSFGLGKSPTHRALFTIRPDEVVILRIRHLSQAPLTEADI